MSLRDHALIGRAKQIPVKAPATPVLSVSPVVLSIAGRPVDLEVRVSVPTAGSSLPIILLSHGHGLSNNLASLNGYGPLANFWAGHGFAVLQPTHLSSKALGLDDNEYGQPLFWRSRIEDMSRIIDQLDDIEDSVPGLKGRLDKDRIAVAGHSLGSHTASMLLGATGTDDDGKWVEMTDPRIKVGILLGALGNGNEGQDLSDFAKGIPIFRNHKFTEMKTPTLVVSGSEDVSPHLTNRGADWHDDPYTCGPSPKTLLTIVGAKHLLGGISGFDASETKDHDQENPEWVAVVQRLTWAYLRSAFYPDDPAWSEAIAALKDLQELAKVESK